jgi:hypothetical protein
LARRSQRNQRRAQANGAARPQTNGQRANGQSPNGSGPSGNSHANGNGNGAHGPNHDARANIYEKYLPEWMKGANGAPVRPPRPQRPRRPRQQRPAGGYTPGKFAIGPGEF